MNNRKRVECSDAEVVLITDDDELEHYGCIELDLSPDEYVYYDHHPGIMQLSLPQNNFTLKFEGYYGKILLPRHALIEIGTDRDVYGKIASPAAIFNESGKLELDVAKDSLLELCLLTSGSLVLNGRNLYPAKKPEECITYGRDADELLKKYISRQKYFIEKKIIDKDEDIYDEYPSEPSRYYRDMCKFYNLLMVQKFGGVSKINYEKRCDFDKNTSLGTFRDNIRYLRRALKKAVSEERYEKAALIKEKIQTNNNCIAYFLKESQKTGK